MQIQITLSGNNFKESARDLRALADTLDGVEVTEAPETKTRIDISEIKKGKSAKKAKTEEDLDLSEAEEESEDEFETDSADTEEEAEDELEEAEEEEAPKTKVKTSAKTAPKGATLDGDIIPAFQTFAKRHSRASAGKVLAKYGVKSVRDLPPAKFGEILKTLRA